MGSTACVFHFDEINEIRPSDAARNVMDLVPPSGLTAPSRAEGIVGWARQWAAAQGLQGRESVVDALRLRRSMSIEALVYPSGDGERFIVQRGANDGTDAERILWGLKLTTTAGSATLQMYWQKDDASAADVDGVTFVQPSGWLYLAAVRRWTSTGQVAVDYYVNGLPVGTVGSTDGDITAGDDGTLLIGVDDGAGTPATGMLAGDRIDELRISNAPRTAEEIWQVYRRLFVYPAWGGDLVRQLLPPDVYTTEPTSRAQRLFGLDGDALATAWSLAGELLDDHWPDRATRTLDGWERLTGLPPRPNETIAARRARIVAFLSTIHGYSRDKIAAAIAPLLGVAPGAVVFIERSNRFVDPFDGSSLGAGWREEPNAGTISVSGGALTLAFQAADDARWNGSSELAVRARRGTDAPGLVEVVALISALDLPNTGDHAGVFFRDYAGNAHLWGLRYDGADLEWAQTTIVGGVATVETYGATVPSLPVYVRLKRTADGVDLSFSAVGAEGPWTVVSSENPGAEGVWAGVFLAGGQAAPADPASVSFSEARLWMPQSRRVFEWFVDVTGLPATADLFAAQAVINKMKPAHTRGLMIGASFLTDDPDSLTDTPGDVLGV